jgi:hypothetical protein
LVLAIMMPPVSVCHQLSWNGCPKTSSPQTTASGLSGSPTLAKKAATRNRSLFGSVLACPHHHADRGGRGVPDLDLLALERAYQRSRSNSASSMIIVTRFTSGAMMP